MSAVILPEGQRREFPPGTTCGQALAALGAPGAEAPLAALLDGEAVDLARPLRDGARLAPLAAGSPPGLALLRHSAAHLLARAVKRLFPGTRFAIGPATEDGFFYDLAAPRPLTAEDLPAIEEEMRRLAAADEPFRRRELAREEARRLLEEQGQDLKLELLAELAAGPFSFYALGEFEDLCRGPHLPDSSRLRHFRLLRVSGAYWKGDTTRPMLQRVYGTAFATAAELEAHLRFLEEARQRDHRELGRELELFSFHPEGPGFPFWHPRGTTLYDLVVADLKARLKAHGYLEIRTPTILGEELWRRSGHWENFRERMYFTEVENRRYAVKPMNCPGGILVYQEGLHSYREFPLRVAELGHVHRFEQSGEMHGLFRVRAFTQDDAHIFCTPEQIQDEVAGAVRLLQEIYRDYGFANLEVELSTRPEKSIGEDEEWRRATAALEGALTALGLPFKVNPGEGAFYGPKIDFHVRDSLMRRWQCGTVQLDFAMPRRFALEYVGPDGGRHPPVMIHRAILGSLERFLGILLEHTAGALPCWLAPVQARLLPVAEGQHDYARGVLEALRQAGCRAEADLGQEKLGYKIRAAARFKLPYLLVVGRREAESGQVAVRERGAGDRGALPLADFVAELQGRVARRE